MEFPHGPQRRGGGGRTLDHLCHPASADREFRRTARGRGDYGDLTVPDWAGPDSRVWLGVPLIHLERLAGLLIIETPRSPRTLNWEDFDLLRTVGRQAASYLAEQASEAALMEARKFEEFNRRFAFIMHDIKNLVSQLSLVARNAERHADNPEFQRDMMLTIKSSVDKMNDLLARLKQHNIQRSDSEAVDLAALLERMVAAKAHAYPGLSLDANGAARVRGHEAKLEQVFGHLIQNAIEASRDGEAIQVALRNGGDAARVEVMDSGVGMSEEFIRNELFTPFRSTKPGASASAYEAREIVKGYGGRIEVQSREGEGLCLRLYCRSLCRRLRPDG
ncbi:PEP-CTERM system histidine kinase PrsK [Hankyongella ginsenosidimutans]|uniref:histidine kinase n=1 Tax=Hankyongella ginsenosidimutans TaxID=1763828 RepID=A0A4D7C1U7_9SPHN|nr:PEP-CTERM system histidine kinase PrsK [Hankyongella ginsenosidimutans]